MKKFCKDLIVSLVLSFVATVGTLAGFIVMGSGFGNWLEEKCKKLFNR